MPNVDGPAWRNKGIRSEKSNEIMHLSGATPDFAGEVVNFDRLHKPVTDTVSGLDPVVEASKGAIRISESGTTKTRRQTCGPLVRDAVMSTDRAGCRLWLGRPWCLAGGGSRTIELEDQIRQYFMPEILLIEDPGVSRFGPFW